MFGLNGVYFYGNEAVGGCDHESAGLTAVPHSVYSTYQARPARPGLPGRACTFPGLSQALTRIHCGPGGSTSWS